MTLIHVVNFVPSRRFLAAYCLHHGVTYVHTASFQVHNTVAVPSGFSDLG